MKEEEIRPQEVFDEYLRLSERDIQRYFADVLRLKVLCPACGQKGQHAFRKKGFDYEQCHRCGTLYVNPRPTLDSFTRYYQQSDSARFWATTFYRVTADARREKLWKPKAKMVWDILKDKNASHHQLIDIGGGYGIFAEEFGKLSGKTVSVIEPGPLLAGICRSKGLTVVECFLEAVQTEQLPEGPRTFVSFELFEHLHEPGSFVKSLMGLMEIGDFFLFTTLSGMGVDIQALWEDSKSVSPPHHLNFFNPYSVRLLLERLGLEVLQITTPGKLDVDILCNNAEHIKDRFWKSFVKYADEHQREQWQSLISDSGWSSHMMVLARKP
jgi:Methyltransferase domain